MKTYSLLKTRENSSTVKPSLFASGLLESPSRQQIREILNSGVIQPKLEIGAPDSACEREADRVAEQVTEITRNDNTVSSSNDMKGNGTTVYRKESEEEKETNENIAFEDTSKALEKAIRKAIADARPYVKRAKTKLNDAKTTPLKRVEIYFKINGTSEKDISNLNKIIENFTIIENALLGNNKIIFDNEHTGPFFNIGKLFGCDTCAYVRFDDEINIVGSCFLHESSDYFKMKIIIHEIAHLLCGMKDHQYLETESSALSTEKAIENADSYAQFAVQVPADSKASLKVNVESIIRSIRSENRPSHEQIRGIHNNGIIQPKLEIGAPDSECEREADLIAERVMRMPEPQANPEYITRKPYDNDDEDTVIHQKSSQPVTPVLTDEIATGIGALKGSGSPLLTSDRMFFEPRMNADLSAVRIHTDTHAAEMAHAINAHAFTIGNDISFAKGMYASGSREGRRLLAHELGHIIEQCQKDNIIQKQSADQTEIGSDSDVLARSIIDGELPLKVVFYDSEETESRFFKYQANEIAQAIGALSLPDKCPRDKIRLQYGATPFTNNDISPILKRIVQCIGKKVSELHIVGHSDEGIISKKSEKYAKYMESDVQVVFHGCSVADFNEDLKKLLNAFGTEAAIIAHPSGRDAGRPHDFQKITLTGDPKKLKKELITQATEVLPESYILRWASLQKSDRLYNLLKDVDLKPQAGEKITYSKGEVQNDAKVIFRDILKMRLKKDVKQWKVAKLEKERNNTERYDWELEIFTEELAERIVFTDTVQYWTTTNLKESLKKESLSKFEKEIIKKELKKRQLLKKDVKKWSMQKLERNLEFPIPWVQEVYKEEIERRKNR